MDKDDVIRMAREAGWRVDSEGEILEGDGWHIQTDIVERFAALVAAAEREAIAKMIEEEDEVGFKDLARRIRARGRE